MVSQILQRILDKNWDKHIGKSMLTKEQVMTELGRNSYCRISVTCKGKKFKGVPNLTNISLRTYLVENLIFDGVFCITSDDYSRHTFLTNSYGVTWWARRGGFESIEKP